MLFRNCCVNIEGFLMCKLSVYELVLFEVYLDVVSGGDLIYLLYFECMVSVVNSWIK